MSASEQELRCEAIRRRLSGKRRKDICQDLERSTRWFAAQVASGNTADEGLYLPLIARARQMLGGVLYVGDSKMAALATRAKIAQQGDYYLAVAPLKGETAKSLPALIEAGLSGGQEMMKLSK